MGFSRLDGKTGRFPKKKLRTDITGERSLGQPEKNETAQPISFDSRILEEYMWRVERDFLVKTGKVL